MVRMKFTEISDEVVRIVPFSEHHITDTYVNWLNDPDVVNYSEQRHKTHTMKSSMKYHDIQKGTNNFIFAIEKLCDKALFVGTLRVLVNSDNNWASLSIMIGDKSCWGSGIGSRAWVLMLDTLLNVLNFRMVIAGTMEVNKPMVKLIKKSGMKIDCVLPGRFIYKGREVGLLWASKFKDT